MSFEESSLTKTRDFGKKSLWIRAYNVCADILCFFRIEAGEYMPVNLCTLLRVYFYTFLLAVAGVLAGLALYAFGSWIVNDYQMHSYTGNQPVETLLNLSGVQILLGVLGAVIGLGVLFGAIALAFVSYDQETLVLRAYGVFMKWAAIFAACVIGVAAAAVTSPLWIPFALWDKYVSPLDSKTPAKKKKPASPSAVDVFSQWLYGLAHGICFDINIIEEEPVQAA